MMENKLELYIGQLFRGAPNTPEVRELKEELFYNSQDKYQDLLAAGKTEDEAMREIKQSIGDVHELIDSLSQPSATDMAEINRYRKRTAKIVSVSVVLYMVAACVLLFFEWVGMEDIGTIIMLFIAIIPTGVLVYHFNAKPIQLENKERIQEIYTKQLKVKSKDERLGEHASSLMWLITVIVFLFLGFTYGIWHVAWIVFIVAAAIEYIIKIIVDMRGE